MRTQRNPRTPVITKVRSMTPEDVQTLREKSHVPQIKRLRESHHRVCYYLSTGASYREVAEATGYSVNRIAVLANTPAVQEQVTQYRNRVLDIKLLKDRDEIKNSLIFRNFLHMEGQLDSVDDAGELLPLRDSIALHKALCGNSGTTVNVNVGFAQRLEAAIASTQRLMESDAA